MRPAGVESKKDIGARKMQRIMSRKNFWAIRTPANETARERTTTNKELAKDKAVKTRISFLLVIRPSSAIGAAHVIQ